MMNSPMTNAAAYARRVANADTARGKVVVKSLFDVTGKISSVGAFAERIAYIYTGTGSGFSMSPLETMVLVVGDPNIDIGMPVPVRGKNDGKYFGGSFRPQ